ncbi:Bug family tripartite tricarboxylate transporter substrate binding protein [Ramlibacter alkalitolerans]|uniref:Bug family tripartite tricarboxylate transporter substrate binding protein n=1 Tax=Ramlibacter alkalitolerans TaxID=2039631 RepID=A0ABS1JPZ4_9BURK|nr:Bug family tripartite tricarboxylate transporter substrate binding protein [Ramlibacter alkalitolerans]MBL0426329.1 Bug family tripartite tricarboxylate transporter substrate binding protein [Ramlibacter alkalitolerans]
MRRRDALIATLLGPATAALHAQGETLRIVTGFAPGGATDRVARIVGEKLQAKLGTTVIVENRTGAGGRLAAQQVKATPAGQHVLMLANPAVLVVAPLVFKDNGYDPERDFVAVSHVNDYEFALSVATAVPVRELSHLLAWLRANPDKANFGVPATGSLPHFFALMLAQAAGVKAQVVGYRGSAPLITDLVGGQIPVSIDTLDTVLPQHQAGKLRILATSGAKRSAIAPDVPTFRESGLNLTATGWNAFFAPASMPGPLVQRYAEAIRDVMADADTQRKLLAAQMSPVVATQAQTEAMLKAYRAQWAPVVTQSGYQP